MLCALLCEFHALCPLTFLSSQLFLHIILFTTSSDRRQGEKRRRRRRRGGGEVREGGRGRGVGGKCTDM
ncbi:hypothetical protein INR49_031643 [Caranx melampygus]|nr:hypothetical protein INR49_031643 [Caranx melampygus]